jgi:hypothetical protein
MNTHLNYLETVGKITLTAGISLTVLSGTITSPAQAATINIDDINFFESVENGTFGMGNGVDEESGLPAGSTTYKLSDGSAFPGTVYPPEDGHYIISTKRTIPNTVQGNQPKAYDTNFYTNEGGFYSWHRLAGHTTGLDNDKFMVVNGDDTKTKTVFFQESVANLEKNTNYEFSAWFMNLIDKDIANLATPNVSFLINLKGVDDNGNGLIDEENDEKEYFNSGNIPETSSPLWRQGKFSFNTKGSTEANFVLRNNKSDKQGNDIAIDDILLRKEAGADPFAFLGNITGLAYIDTNGDNAYNDGEQKLSNIDVVLKNLAGETITSTKTKNDGTYEFVNIKIGDYRVEVKTDDTDLPANSVLGTEGKVTVNIAQDQTKNADFGFDIQTVVANPTVPVDGAPRPTEPPAVIIDPAPQKPPVIEVKPQGFTPVPEKTPATVAKAAFDPVTKPITQKMETIRSGGIDSQTALFLFGGGIMSLLFAFVVYKRYNEKGEEILL